MLHTQCNWKQISSVAGGLNSRGDGAQTCWTMCRIENRYVKLHNKSAKGFVGATLTAILQMYGWISHDIITSTALQGEEGLMGIALCTAVQPSAWISSKTDCESALADLKHRWAQLFLNVTFYSVIHNLFNTESQGHLCSLFPSATGVSEREGVTCNKRTWTQPTEVWITSTRWATTYILSIHHNIHENIIVCCMLYTVRWFRYRRPDTMTVVRFFFFCHQFWLMCLLCCDQSTFVHHPSIQITCICSR